MSSIKSLTLPVAPRAGAWIETAVSRTPVSHSRMSLPVRERGLKHVGVPLIMYYPVAPRAGAWIETSYPLELKEISDVAPRAGAWIETGMTASQQTMAGSLPVRERGLKHHGRRAPGRHLLSLPVRERGLKRQFIPVAWSPQVVAPRAGAWIETMYRRHAKGHRTSRSPCGSVD